MLKWKRTRSLAYGHCVTEEVKIGDNMKIVVDYFNRQGVDETRFHFFLDDNCVIFKQMKSTNIEDAKAEAYKIVREYVNEQIGHWSGILYSMWKEECWDDGQMGD